MVKLMKTKVKMIISVSLFVVDVVYLLSINRWLGSWLVKTGRHNIYYGLIGCTALFVILALFLLRSIARYWNIFKAERHEKYQQMKAKEAISEDLDE